jgi:hypothetical protein
VAETRGVGEYLDRYDLPVGNREPKDDARVPAVCPDGSDDAVDERQLRGARSYRERGDDGRRLVLSNTLSG